MKVGRVPSSMPTYRGYAHKHKTAEIMKQSCSCWIVWCGQIKPAWQYRKPQQQHELRHDLATAAANEVGGGGPWRVGRWEGGSTADVLDQHFWGPLAVYWLPAQTFCGIRQG